VCVGAGVGGGGGGVEALRVFVKEWEHLRCVAACGSLLQRCCSVRWSVC